MNSDQKSNRLHLMFVLILERSVDIRGTHWYPQFFQKTNEKNRLYYDTSGRLIFVCFLLEIKDTKKTFRNYLTFISCNDWSLDCKYLKYNELVPLHNIINNILSSILPLVHTCTVVFF